MKNMKLTHVGTTISPFPALSFTDHHLSPDYDRIVCFTKYIIEFIIDILKKEKNIEYIATPFQIADSDLFRLLPQEKVL